MTTATGAALAYLARATTVRNMTMNTTSALFAASNDVTATAAVLAAGGNVELLRDAVLELAELLADARAQYGRKVNQLDIMAREYEVRRQLS